MAILKMSLSASILILAIVIIRALVLHKLPKKTFLVLWGLCPDPYRVRGKEKQIDPSC